MSWRMRVLLWCLVLVFAGDRADSFGQIAFVEQGHKLDVGDHVYFGVSAGDLDGDGIEDIYHGRHQTSPHIALNDGTGVFVVRNKYSILPARDRDRHGATLVDIDNDGDKDIFVGSGNNKPHEMWRNDGTGETFVDLWLGQDPQDIVGRERTTVWFDWNGDTFPDVYMLVGRDNEFSRFGENVGGTGVFIDRTEELGLAEPLAYTHGTGGCGLADYDGDGDMDMFVCVGKSRGGLVGAKLFRHNDDGTFTDVLGDLMDDAARIEVSSSRWGDYDNDGDLDLYLARGVTTRHYGHDSRLSDGVYLADKNTLQFFSRLDVAEGDRLDRWRVRVGSSANSIAVDLQAFRRVATIPALSEVFLGPDKANPAGFPIVIDPQNTAMRGSPRMDQTGLYFWMSYNGKHLHCAHCYVPASSGDDDVRPTVTGYITSDIGALGAVRPIDMERASVDYADQLYRNDGATFTNVTAEMGIDNDSPAVVAVWGDFDNDADLDLLVVNKHYDVPVTRPLVIYRNDGVGGFVDVAATAGLAGCAPNSIITSVAVADFNVDGYLDFICSNEEGPPPVRTRVPSYYESAGGANRWLEIRLVGTRSNRDAIGAKVWLTMDDRVQFREQNGGVHAFGQDSTVVHFGVADDEAVNLTIQWPAGGVQTLTDVATNQRITITEPQP